MFVVELVMQGVRGIRGPARLRFQSGFNLVSAGNESGKTTAVDSMLRLLFPNSQTAAMASLVPRNNPGAVRGALVACSDDGAYYRVIQDFSRRVVNLSRYNASTREFNLLHKDWDNSSQFMAGLTAGAAEDDYARVFVFRREHAVIRPVSHDPVPAPERGSTPNAAGDPAAAARIAELREILRKAEEAADAEYRHQSAKLALDEIRKKLESLEEIERKRAEMASTLAELKACETLPEDLREQIEAYERRESQKAVDTDNLHKELEGLQRELGEVPQVNFVTDKLFIAGAVLGVLSILAGVFFLTAEYENFFPIGVIVSLILISVASYNGTRKNAQRRAIRRELEALDQDLVDLERQFVQDGAVVAAAMRAVGAGSTAELKEKADHYRHVLSLKEDLEEGRARILGNTTPELLQQQFEQQQKETGDLEQAARSVAHDAVDTLSIRQDIERLESASAAKPVGDFGAAADALVPDFEPTAAGPHEEGLLGELRSASRIGGVEMETLVPAVEAAAQRNLSAVTGGRYVRLEVGRDGLPIVHTQDDMIVEAAQLSHGTKDLIYFCFRTGLVEALAGKRLLPFILDDALAGFDPARQQAACRILRTLGKKTQVILFTANPGLRAAGDAALELT